METAWHSHPHHPWRQLDNYQPCDPCYPRLVPLSHPQHTHTRHLAADIRTSPEEVSHICPRSARLPSWAKINAQIYANEFGVVCYSTIIMIQLYWYLVMWSCLCSGILSCVFPKSLPPEFQEVSGTLSSWLSQSRFTLSPEQALKCTKPVAPTQVLPWWGPLRGSL